MRRPTGPPLPGAAPTPDSNAVRVALVGRFAKIQIDSGGGAADLALLFDWELNANFDYADATAHGDQWKQKVFMDADWTARARGYVVTGSTTHYIKDSTTSTGPILLTFIGYSDMGTHTIWSGPCYIARGRISVPMAMAEQEFELVSSGKPTAGSAF